MRLIEADKVIPLVRLLLLFHPNAERIIEDMQAVVDSHTIEAEPVRHGRWEECDWVEYDGHSECVRYPKKGRVCTNCRNAFKKEFIDNPRVHYCPNCGAKMERRADDDNS